MISILWGLSLLSNVKGSTFIFLSFLYYGHMIYVADKDFNQKKPNRNLKPVTITSKQKSTLLHPKRRENKFTQIKKVQNAHNQNHRKCTLSPTFLLLQRYGLRHMCARSITRNNSPRIALIKRSMTQVLFRDRTRFMIFVHTLR